MSIESGGKQHYRGLQPAADLGQSALESGADDVVIGASSQRHIARSATTLTLADFICPAGSRECRKAVDRYKTNITAIPEMTLDPIAVKRAEIGNDHGQPPASGQHLGGQGYRVEKAVARSPIPTGVLGWRSRDDECPSHSSVDHVEGCLQG